MDKEKIKVEVNGFHVRVTYGEGLNQIEASCSSHRDVTKNLSHAIERLEEVYKQKYHLEVIVDIKGNAVIVHRPFTKQAFEDEIRTNYRLLNELEDQKQLLQAEKSKNDYLRQVIAEKDQVLQHIRKEVEAMLKEKTEHNSVLCQKLNEANDLRKPIQVTRAHINDASRILEEKLTQDIGYTADYISELILKNFAQSLR